MMGNTEDNWGLFIKDTVISLSISQHVPYQVMMMSHFWMTSPMTLIWHKKFIITSYLLVWRVNQLGKLINRIPGSPLLISSSALRTHVELLGKLAMSTSVLKAKPGKLDIKRHSPSVFYWYSLPLICQSQQKSSAFLVCWNICPYRSSLFWVHAVCFYT